MKQILIFMLVLYSCSSKKGPTVSPDEYLKLNQNHSAKHKACIKHRTQVLENPITETEEAELDDELYFFLRNEAKAVAYMEHFDLSKFTLRENQLENEAIINACVLKRHPKYVQCDTLMPAFKFFRGLIYGMNQYGWKKETILKAKSITLSYLDYIGRSDSSLMDILFANDLLMRLTQEGYVSETLYNDTILFRAQGEKVFKELNKQMKKLGKKEVTCEDVASFYSNERVKVKELSQDFLKLLEKVK
jgi:hypothetical protein